MASITSRPSASTSRTARAAAIGPACKRASASTANTSPASRSPMNEIAAPAREAPAKASFRVLVVDDDPDMAAFLERLLAATGLGVDHALDRRAGLSVVRSQTPDLILLVLILPATCGIQTLELL